MTSRPGEAGGAAAFELEEPRHCRRRRGSTRNMSTILLAARAAISPPELVWSDPPPGTKSFAVLAHDPDAPTGGAGFWHWLVVDIPADARGLEQGAGDAPAKTSRRARNSSKRDFGEKAYGGPCPPPGARIAMSSPSMRSRSTSSETPGKGAPPSPASRSTPMRSPRRRSLVFSGGDDSLSRAAVALVALAIDAGAGYPEWLFARIGHPATWLGALVSALDAGMNRDRESFATRRAKGVVALLLLAGAALLAGALIETGAEALPFGCACRRRACLHPDCAAKPLRTCRGCRRGPVRLAR